jgi:hypothetical protein
MDDETLEQELLEASSDAAEVAIADLLEHGISVFYRENDYAVREDPNGERFEIQFLEIGGSHTVIRKLPPLAA